MKIPTGLEYWTADEIAECLGGIAMATRQRLWEFVGGTDDKPLGGDGSNGTTEIPIVDHSYGNQPRAFWSKLTKAQQEEIATAYKAEQGERLRIEGIGHAGMTPQEVYDDENPAPLENPMDWEQ